MATTQDPSSPPSQNKFIEEGSLVMGYQSIPHYFYQSELETNDQTFDWSVNLGLKGTWSELQQSLTELNAGADKGYGYKLLYLGRHGEGYHNRAILKYGQKEWDRKWSLLDGDGELVWGPDPELTDVGEAQAQKCNDIYSKLRKSGMIMPQVFYVSPFQRTLKTMQISWSRVPEYETQEKLFVHEMIRETIGVHSCDERKTIDRTDPKWSRCDFSYIVDDKDVLWTREHRETDPEMDVRIIQFLDDIFGLPETIVSVTAHAGVLRTFLRVTGHRKFFIETGSVIPIVVYGPVKTC